MAVYWLYWRAFLADEKQYLHRPLLPGGTPCGGGTGLARGAPARSIQRSAVISSNLINLLINGHSWPFLWPYWLRFRYSLQQLLKVVPRNEFGVSSQRW